MKANALVFGWYYDFNCPGGDCGLTCCSSEWSIKLTDDEIDKYQKIEGEFGEKVRDSIDYDKKTIRCNSGKCNLMNSDGYCDLYLNCGEGYLSDTCRLFPRRSRYYGDVVEVVVEIVCPLVAEYLFENKPFDFDVQEIELDNYKVVDYNIYDNLAKSRTALVSIMSVLPGQFISGKVFVMLSVFEQVKKLFADNNITDSNMNAILDNYCNDEIVEKIFLQCEAMQDMHTEKNIVMYKLFKELKKYNYIDFLLNNLYSRYPKLVECFEKWDSDQKKFEMDVNEFKAYFKMKYPEFDERFFTYVLINNWIELEKEEFGKEILMKFFEYFITVLGAAAMFRGRLQEINKKEMSILVAAIDRRMTHSINSYEEFYRYYDELLSGNITNLMMLV